MNWPNVLVELIRKSFYELWNLDWSSVQFKKEYFAVRAAMLIGAAILLKILWPFFGWRRNRSGVLHSGYGITSQNKARIFDRIMNAIPLAVAVAGSVLVFLAIADPYQIYSHETKPEESREIVYLRDTSKSMGFRYRGTEKSRADIVQEFLLRLADSRRGKNDRAAYMVFSTLPRLKADFTTSTDSLLFSVAMNPTVIADPVSPSQFPGKFIVEDFEKIKFEGGTDLYLGLEATVKLFDKKGDPKIAEEIKKNPTVKKRSSIIITDGASDRDPESQFRELKKRSIVPYLVLIEPDMEAEVKMHGEDKAKERIALAHDLLRLAKRYGGDSFWVTNEKTLDEVRKRLDRLHTTVAGLKIHTTEVHIYRPFLVAAVVLFALAIVLRLILWVYHKLV